ncbi:hypothetical protein ACKZDW_18485 [Ralstonia syzygii subsp. celebesensis]
MHRIDGAGNVNGTWVAEDPATNRPPTEITAAFMNALQEELAAVIEWAGVQLAKADNTQLREALAATFAQLSGAAFTSIPTAPAAPRFDNSEKLVNSAFLKASGLCMRMRRLRLLLRATLPRPILVRIYSFKLRLRSRYRRLPLWACEMEMLSPSAVTGATAEQWRSLGRRTRMTSLEKQRPSR